MSAIVDREKLAEANAAYNNYMTVLSSAVGVVSKPGKYIIMTTTGGGNFVMNYAGGDTPREALLYAGLDIVGAVLASPCVNSYTWSGGISDAANITKWFLYKGCGDSIDDFENLNDILIENTDVNKPMAVLVRVDAASYIATSKYVYQVNY
jgi:hypothetical protein